MNDDLPLPDNVIIYYSQVCILQVTIGSIAAALLGFAGSDGKKEHQPTENLVEIIAMILLPVAVLMVGYALMVFVWRSKAIAKKQVNFKPLPTPPYPFPELYPCHLFILTSSACL